MTKAKARAVRCARWAAQGLGLAFFILLFLRAGDPSFPGWASRGFFFALDPLFLILTVVSARVLVPLALLSLIPLALTVLFGRVFCGWFCPLGTLHQVTSRLLAGGLKKRPDPDSRRLKIKYLILAAVIAAAVLRLPLGGWLDPVSLLTRSAASAIDPAVTRLVPAAGGGPRLSSQPVLIGGLFLLFVALNALRRRFFCNVLCPLGALYGLIARFSAFRVTSDGKCRSCRACSRGCSYDGDPAGRFLSSECTVCLNCAVDCPSGSVSFRFRPAWKKPRPAAVDIGRRRIVGAALLGGAAAILPLTSLSGGAAKKRRFIRPPGSVRERDFLDRCVRCGLCVRVCPTGFLQPALLEAGAIGIWTPITDARAGACDFECRRCTLVCAARAIEPLTLDEKKRFKIGTAVVNKSVCYTYADGFNCTACADRCPIPEKAIRFHEAETWDFRGKRVLVRQISVVPELCTGCGICENVCPRGGTPGIFVIPEDEAREAPGGA
jgi:polyferredoxin